MPLRADLLAMREACIRQVEEENRMPNRYWRAGVARPTGVVRFVRTLLIALLPLVSIAVAARADVLDVPAVRQDGGGQGMEVMVRGPWGDASGEFGKVDEASRPGPMDFVATGGRLYVLDPVNARVQVFRDDGSFERQIDIGTRTADFLAVGDNGDVAVMDAFARREILIFNADGKLRTRCGIPADVRLPSAIFLDGERVLIESRHDRVYELAVPADVRGATASTVRTLAGRPVAAGGGELHARMAGTREIALQAPLGKSTGDGSTLRFQREVESIVALESDTNSRVHLAVTCPIEGSTDAWHTEIVVVVLNADGTIAATLHMPNRYVTDHYRKLGVSDSGDIIQMQTTEADVRFVRWVVEPQSGKGGSR